MFTRLDTIQERDIRMDGWTDGGISRTIHSFARQKSRFSTNISFLSRKWCKVCPQLFWKVNRNSCDRFNGVISNDLDFN